MNMEHMYVQSLERRRGRVVRWHELYDLLVLSGVALVLPLLLMLPVPLVRLPLGLAMALLAPGYALVEALFPCRDDIEDVTRFALSFGLSAALIPLLALLLDKLPWGIRPLPIAISLAGWIVVLCGVAAWRRARIPAHIAHGPPLPDPSGWWRGLDPRRRTGYMLGTLALVGLFGTATLVLLLPDPSGFVTEFYLLGKEGLAEDYPREAVVGEEVTVAMGIMNREQDTHTYRVEVWAVQPWAPDQRELVGQAGPVTLLPGQQQEEPISWHMPWSGDNQRVDFLLFIEGGSQPYRQLRLWVNVVQ